MQRFLSLILCTYILAACNWKDNDIQQGNGAFIKKADNIHIERIVNSGELIITTLNGPDTYFDYQGVKLGIQYALVEEFASYLGVRIRVELAIDTLDMFKKLESGEVDLIACQIPLATIKKHKGGQAGASYTQKRTSWAIRKEETDLAEELNTWYNQNIEFVVKQVQTQRMQSHRQIKHKAKAPFIDREKGIISIYDNLFKKAGQRLNWDWKLLAAQCYQESGFDPQAVSYRGAQGLMQIMPGTAQYLQIYENQIFEPAVNINGAVLYLLELKEKFRYIRNELEQIKFVLAAYNGGLGHIQDAQALAEKYGKDPTRWNEVSPFILKLSEPEFYQDERVKNGFMVGSETYNYVNDIIQRWQSYGGNFSLTKLKNQAAQKNAAQSTMSRGDKHSHKQKIYSLDELKGTTQEP